MLKAMDGTSRYLDIWIFQTVLVINIFLRALASGQILSIEVCIAFKQLGFIAVFIQGKIAFAVEVFSFI